MENYKETESNFLNNLSEFDISSSTAAIGTFKNLWVNDTKFKEHYEKRRVKEGVIDDEFDYISKTFDALNSKDAYYETFDMPDLWDRVFYSRKNRWTVIIAKNGKILTSYKINNTIEDTFEKHKKMLGAKILKVEVSDEFTREIKKITNKLRAF